MADKFSVTETFLNAATPLIPRDAVAAIIVNEENQILLQLRDDKEEIFFPNHWGCFGGAIDDGESPNEALLRELDEELGIDVNPESIAQFSTISFNPTPTHRDVARYFYIVKVTSEIAKNINLGEGSAFEFFTFEEVMKLTNTSPYDRFGLWLYFNQNRLSE